MRSQNFEPRREPACLNRRSRSLIRLNSILSEVERRLVTSLTEAMQLSGSSDEAMRSVDLIKWRARASEDEPVSSLSGPTSVLHRALSRSASPLKGREDRDARNARSQTI